MVGDEFQLGRRDPEVWTVFLDFVSFRLRLVNPLGLG